MSDLDSRVRRIALALGIAAGIIGFIAVCALAYAAWEISKIWVFV